MQASRAGAYGDAVRDADVGSHASFKFFHFGAEAQACAAQHLGDGFNLTVGNVGCRKRDFHHAPACF